LTNLRSITLRNLLVIGLTVVNLLVMGLSASVLFQSREQYFARAVTHSQSTASALDQSLTGSFEKIDLVLRTVSDELEAQLARKTLDEAKTNRFLLRQNQRLPELDSIRVSDAQGYAILGNDVNKALKVSWTDRVYFQYHRDHANDITYVDKPLFGRISQKFVIPISRRYNHPDGRFAGIVTGSIAIPHFSQLMGRFDLGQNGIAVLRDESMGLISRVPPLVGSPVGTVGNRQIPKEFQAALDLGQRAGTIDTVVGVDGIARIFTFRRIEKMPMYLVAAVAHKDAFKDWYEEVYTTFGFVLGFFLLTLITGIFMTRQLKRNAQDNKRNQVYLQRASDGIQIMNSKGQIVQVNDRMAELFGQTRAQMIGLKLKTWSAYWPDENLPPNSFKSVFCKTGTSTVQTWIQNTNGARVDVEVSASTFEIDQDTFLYVSVRDLTQRKQSERTLQENEAKLRVLFDLLPLGLVLTDTEGQLVEFNNAFLNITGYSAQEIKDLQLREVTPAKYAAANPTQKTAGKLASRLTDHFGPYEKDYVHKDGRLIPVRFNGVRITGRDGKDYFWSLMEDITESRAREDRLRMAASVFENSYEGIVVTDIDTTVVDVNPAFSRITGYSREDILGKTPAVLASGRHRSDFFTKMWETLSTKDFWQGELWNRRKNGDAFAVMMSISVIRDDSGLLLNYLGVFSDITESKLHEAELHRIAHYDPLTGVPNRRLMTERLNQAVARTRRAGNHLAVCYMDLDGFKAVNDLHGHEAGDLLLVTLSERITATLRTEDTLARLGGDEFVLLLSDLAAPSDCRLVLQRVLEAANAPVALDATPNSKTVQVSASIGVAVFPHDDVDADVLLRHADQAMYRAKEGGKNAYHIFDPAQDREQRARQSSLVRLREALERQEFVLHYQPKVDMVNGDVVGAEALIRWQHPERGLLPPGEFLSYLDGSELEVALGEWVIAQVLRQIEEWQQLHLDFKVSANVSAHHLLQANFADRLRQAVQRHPAQVSASLELEILETAALADIGQAVQVLGECRTLGVSFSLDDFGTGYSSLTYFRKLPLDYLKIDQSFVRDMMVDPDDLGIVETVVRLAQAFNRPVIAEGVETLEHAAKLVDIGCRFGQGYGIGRPMSHEHMLVWLKKWQDQKAWLAWAGTIV
jgi:diguanylate cyclase (GGDEF)-like protein/PAS domain S-box-containing protein